MRELRRQPRPQQIIKHTQNAEPTNASAPEGVIEARVEAKVEQELEKRLREAQERFEEKLNREQEARQAAEKQLAASRANATGKKVKIITPSNSDNYNAKLQDGTLLDCNNLPSILSILSQIPESYQRFLQAILEQTQNGRIKDVFISRDTFSNRYGIRDITLTNASKFFAERNWIKVNHGYPPEGGKGMPRSAFTLNAEKISFKTINY